MNPPGGHWGEARHSVQVGAARARDRAPRGADSNRWSLPALVLALGLLLTWGWFFPEYTQFDRGQIRHGEWWRVWSGHFAHWGFPHLAANLMGLALLGGLLLGRLGPRRVLLIAMLAATLGSLALWLLLPDMELYRGASGLVWGWGGAWVAMLEGRLLLLPAAVLFALLPLAQAIGFNLSSLPPVIANAWPVHLAGFGVGFGLQWMARRGAPKV